MARLDEAAMATARARLVGRRHPVGGQAMAARAQLDGGQAMAARAQLDGGQAMAARAHLDGGQALDRHEELAIWLAGATGSERPVVRARVITAGPRLPLRDATEPALTVAEVAHAVDRGRDEAASAAADGVTVVLTAPIAAATEAALCLTAVLTGRDLASLTNDDSVHARCRRALTQHPNAARGPLHALRRLGTGEIAFHCGLALGAGEHGLACLCDDLDSTVAAAVAVGIEPGLRPRVLAAPRSPQPAHRALLDHLGLAPLTEGAPAALAFLREAAALLHG